MTDAWYNVVHPIDLVLRCSWFDGVLCSAKNCRSVERDLVRMGIGKGWAFALRFEQLNGSDDRTIEAGVTMSGEPKVEDFSSTQRRQSSARLKAR